MKKKSLLYLIVFTFILITIMFIQIITKNKYLTGLIIYKNNNYITIQDNQNIIYTIKANDINENIGSYIKFKYNGTLNKNNQYQNIDILEYKIISNNNIPNNWLDDGIFKNYYKKAYNKMQTLSLDEKIGQILLVRLPDNNSIETLLKYQFGGYIFYQKDFDNKTEQEVKNMINDLQKEANIPLLTAVDEEGGKVIRISNNPNLVSSKFKSSKELYITGGLKAIEKDTIYKSKILSNLGINLNLAPVVDISTNKDDYIYERTLGENAKITSEYSKTVINASKKTSVSYTLKHFPGYGNNKDTHKESSIDSKTIQELKENDFLPFESGIKADAEAIMINHNILLSIDKKEASLSPSIHNILRNELNFTGIIITDDLNMGATSTNENATIEAILAGNDLIITTDYEHSINSIKKALNNNVISEEQINKIAFRIIAWKYYKQLIRN